MCLDYNGGSSIQYIQLKITFFFHVSGEPSAHTTTFNMIVMIICFKYSHMYIYIYIIV